MRASVKVQTFANKIGKIFLSKLQQRARPRREKAFGARSPRKRCAQSLRALNRAVYSGAYSAT